MGSLCRARYGSFQRKFETNTRWRRQTTDHLRRIAARTRFGPSHLPRAISSPRRPIVSQDASAISIIRCRPPRARRRHLRDQDGRPIGPPFWLLGIASPGILGWRARGNETDSCAVALSLPLGPIGRCNPRGPDSRNLSAAPCRRVCGDSHVNVGMSPRRFVWPVLLTLIGGWVVHTSPRTPFGFLQALVWLAVVIFVWAYALWRRRG